MLNFFHGVEVVEIDDGPRPIQTVRSSVIGLVGTAPDADADRFPLDTPVLIAGRRSDMQGIGDTGTLPAALNDIFDQTGALIVVVRVETFVDANEQIAAIIGGVDTNTGKYLGISAFLGAESEIRLSPKILIAPEFSHNVAVANTLITVSEGLRAISVADGPNTNDSDAFDFRDQFGSPRLYIVDPWVRIFDTVSAAEITRPVSARVSGLIAKSDSDFGFWRSPSNQELRGLLGLGRDIDFALGDPNSRANRLNEQEVTTIIQQDGYRLWGNRTTSSDPKWAFLSVRRTADMINESLLRAHFWAVDRNITKTYLEDIVESVNAYLRFLRTQGAIINGQAWADPELNTPDQISQGKVFIDFDFTPPFPAEHITFRSHLVNDYLVEVLPGNP